MSLDFLFGAGIFVHLALIFYGLGFLFRDELLLRALILTGTVFYLIYYFYAADTPLWDAIFGSSVLFIINSTMILIILRERTTLTLNKDETELYGVFNTLTPGQFRRLMKIAKWHEPKAPTLVVKEGQRSDRLFFSMPGKIYMEKEGKTFTVNGNMFIGEVGFMLDEPASASVTLLPGTKFVEWKSEDLLRLMKKSQPMENALKAMFNYDLAQKVSKSFGKQVI